MDTIGSSFDTTLGVYRGTAVNTLTSVAQNNNISAGNTRSRVTFTATNGVIYNLVRVIGCEFFIREQGIGVERGSSSDVLAYFVLQYLAAAARNHAGANLAATFQDADHCGLILAASSGNPALPFADVHVPSLATDESLIHFNFTAELRTEKFILHRKTNTLQHEPCRLLGDLHVVRLCKTIKASSAR